MLIFHILYEKDWILLYIFKKLFCNYLQNWHWFFCFKTENSTTMEKFLGIWNTCFINKSSFICITWCKWVRDLKKWIFCINFLTDCHCQVKLNVKLNLTIIFRQQQVLIRQNNKKVTINPRYIIMNLIVKSTYLNKILSTTVHIKFTQRYFSLIKIFNNSTSWIQFKLAIFINFVFVSMLS